MALPDWPTALPELRGRIADAGTDALYRAPVVTPFDDGPSRSRRRGLFNSVTLRITLDLTFVTLPVFLTFARETLGDGTRRFAAPVVLPNGTMATRTCRIEGAVSLSWTAPPRSRASFLLTVWNWK